MDMAMGMATDMDMEMKKRNRICLCMIKSKYIGVWLLWIVCIGPAYAQHAPVTAVREDTVNLVTREKQMQARLENYVQLMSSRTENRSKVDVLLMPVAGFHPSQLSYGLMAGVMRRTGGYVKVKYSFSKVPEDDFECDDGGGSTEDGQVRWFTGRTKKSRLAFTGGIVQRLYKLLYLYAGAGYGNRVLVWETVGGTWGKNKEHSYAGVEAEIGGIIVVKHLVLSIGAQTNSFEYLEGNVGVGVIF